MELHKKILPGYYEELASGAKNYDMRLAEDDIAGAKPGDTLVLEEYTSLDKATRKPTGRILKKMISDARHFTLDKLSEWWPREEIEQKGFVIFSLKD